MKGEALVSTVLFDNEIQILHDRVPLNHIEKMTEEQYYVRGCTALLDAVGGAIRHIAGIHKYARKEDVPEKTIFVITTDGMENASYKYSSDEVKNMIKKETEKYGWEFIFLGANIDAVEAAGNIGIAPERAVNYHSDSVGTKKNYEALNCAIAEFRYAETLSDDWRKDIDEDYKNRGKICE